MPSASPHLKAKLWVDLITGQQEANFEFLAAKLFLGNARARFREAPECLSDLARDLCATLTTNQHLPSVQRDLIRLQSDDRG